MHHIRAATEKQAVESESLGSIARLSERDIRLSQISSAALALFPGVRLPHDNVDVGPFLANFHATTDLQEHRSKYRPGLLRTNDEPLAKLALPLVLQRVYPNLDGMH